MAPTETKITSMALIRLLIILFHFHRHTGECFSSSADCHHDPVIPSDPDRREDRFAPFSIATEARP
jgi:hypothetical protein